MQTLTHRIPSLMLIDHEFSVPLDHAKPMGEHITIFARELAEPQGPQLSKPWLVFFQGGPGGKSPRPMGKSGWWKRALQEYRVLLLDQRGTGRSTPVTHRSLLLRGNTQAQASYLQHFRADAIIHELGLGLTIMYVRGGFSGDEREILYVICERLQLAELKDLILSEDPSAFIAIENLHEVANGKPANQKKMTRMGQIFSKIMQKQPENE